MANEEQQQEEVMSSEEEEELDDWDRETMLGILESCAAPGEFAVGGPWTGESHARDGVCACGGALMPSPPFHSPATDMMSLMHNLASSHSSQAAP